VLSGGATLPETIRSSCLVQEEIIPNRAKKSRSPLSIYLLFSPLADFDINKELLQNYAFNSA
jgi:hypothetical protein